ncbi:MAG: hypothetical protein ACOYM3_35375 [Terrimicrobiaceae bacterium]
MRRSIVRQSLPSTARLPPRPPQEIQGRHNRSEGFLADMEKYFEAALAGWTVLRLSERQLTLEIVERIVRLVGR